MRDDRAVDWITDPRWKHVYTHTPKGLSLCGSRKQLIKAIQTGRRVRFQLPDASFYTAEVDNLHVRHGHVTAQAIKLVEANGSNQFDGQGIWNWLMVSTTG